MIYSTAHGKTYTTLPWVTGLTSQRSSTSSIPVPFIPDDYGLHEYLIEVPDCNDRLLRGGIVEQKTASGVSLNMAPETSKTNSETSVGSVVLNLLISPEPNDSLIIRSLEDTADLGDRRMFAEQVTVIDWSARRPEELTRAIDLALSLDLATLGTKLAQQGGQLFPHDERVQRAYQVLRPPVISVSSEASAKGLESSRNWLRDHASQYRGLWVAVRDGQLIGVEKSLKELTASINQDLSKTLITKVL